jgi:hypothetical protein
VSSQNYLKIVKFLICFIYNLLSDIHNCNEIQNYSILSIVIYVSIQINVILSYIVTNDSILNRYIKLLLKELYSKVSSVIYVMYIYIYICIHTYIYIHIYKVLFPNKYSYSSICMIYVYGNSYSSNINDKINARMVMYMVILKFKSFAITAPLTNFTYIYTYTQMRIYIYIATSVSYGYLYSSNIKDSINARMVIHMVILKFKSFDFTAPLADFAEGESVGGGSDAVT